jgi:hypothetical protein
MKIRLLSCQFPSEYRKHLAAFYLFQKIGSTAANL